MGLFTSREETEWGGHDYKWLNNKYNAFRSKHAFGSNVCTKGRHSAAENKQNNEVYSWGSMDHGMEILIRFILDEIETDKGCTSFNMKQSFTPHYYGYFGTTATIKLEHYREVGNVGAPVGVSYEIEIEYVYAPVPLYAIQAFKRIGHA